MLKKISMVALLVSVCTAASAFTTFNKSVDKKLKNPVVSVKEKTTNESCSCDTAALEGKIKNEMQAMRDDYNNQIKSIINSIEDIKKNLGEIQSKK